MERVVARNPGPDSALPFLLRLPLGDGLLFRTKGTWPRTGALYCHPVQGLAAEILSASARAGQAAVLTLAQLKAVTDRPDPPELVRCSGTRR